jgi:hypothetical protein
MIALATATLAASPSNLVERSPVAEWMTRAETILEGSPECSTTQKPSDRGASDTVPTRTTCVFRADQVVFHKGAPRDVTVWRPPLGITGMRRSSPEPGYTPIRFTPGGHYLLWLTDDAVFTTVDTAGEAYSVLVRLQPDDAPALAADTERRVLGWTWDQVLACVSESDIARCHTNQRVPRHESSASLRSKALLRKQTARPTDPRANMKGLASNFTTESLRCTEDARRDAQRGYRPGEAPIRARGILCERSQSAFHP